MNSYPVAPDLLFLVAPNQIHSFEGFRCTDGIVFLFCQDFYVEEFSFMRLLNLYSNTPSGNSGECWPAFVTRGNGNNNFVEILRSIQLEYEMSGSAASSPVIIRSLLNILLLKLTDLTESMTGSKGKTESTFVHSLSNLIESYFIQEHNIGFYTDAFNCSEKYLNDVCNRHFKCGLKKILLDRLMQESRRLLLSSELTVSQIAYKLNFQDASYFNKVFSRSTGLSPKKFREMHRKLLP